jgi:thiamine pyrophosphate-dependent acetolactate synthase large subunit-like protein
MTRTGRHAIIEQFLADGMDHMFGNPGTVEQGFLDALQDHPAMKYILTLQESVAVLMADGYARSTQRPTLVQIHSTPGLGNAIGALYQAMRGHSPLVVIGGDAGMQYINMDAQMAGDLVAMARPVTKYATTVTDPRSLLRTIRRAIKIAATPPMGPVYVCLPMDVLDAENHEDARPTLIPSTRSIPPREDIAAVADILRSAATPIIFMGDGIAYSQANVELAALAETLGAEVYGVDVGDVNMDTMHPSYQGTTGHMFGSASLPITRKGDVNLVVGTYMVPEVFPDLGDIFAPGARVIHVDLNAYEIAKNHRVDIAMVADPKLTLASLTRELHGSMTESDRAAAAARFRELARRKDEKRSAELTHDAEHRGALPLRMEDFMEPLAKRLPAGAIIFDEALTNSPAVTRYAPPRDAGSYFQTRGGSLGVGIPGAMGVAMAQPSRTVIGFTGDGGSMYTIQALWSAVRHNVPAKFVVCNNQSYKLLQLNITAYWNERDIPAHDYPLSFDLSRPALRFDRIAESMGVAAVRVERPEQIVPAIDAMLGHNGPFLIDLVLEGDVKPELVGVRCGQ